MQTAHVGSVIGLESSEEVGSVINFSTLPFTGKILKVSPLSTLTDICDNIAERLLILTHYGADFNIWGKRVNRYWDAFAEQCKASCYHGPGVWDWWSHMSESLPSTPRDSVERGELAEILSVCRSNANLDVGVVNVFRTNTPVMILRLRVIAESWKTFNGYDIDSGNE